VRPAAHQVDHLLEEIRQRNRVNERVLVTTLTKKSRGASDRTTTTNSACASATCTRNTETIERVDIIRDLRRGVFDVLVGINLLRERARSSRSVPPFAILDPTRRATYVRSARSFRPSAGAAATSMAP